ncbi:UDP-N-acetyl glucosamine 2-epimerase [Halapricum hydrolyticum]|uniref:UDP-N-acetylglucosamine 2-epimerase n=1 Tax=Halapricum hydrolyticum TaxID=2979991 RepID=A0AAE3IFG5_9EURY|nr:UDP-N-acetylglucosamine 2-epimerase [Halapricum hydrolyticum]MCU4718629.1 UDP-N-acetylglucosamine 2-epimerase [Halapricum hydrolyticum]MCU4727684.1 UDP-N-acetylglucosamine 2-epimerase [Halapricum hydrolyticum]
MPGELTIYEDRLARQMDAGEFVLAVVTATKPDFYKQAPVVAAARDAGVPAFVLHTGQHYDDVLGHGLAEYGIEDRVAADLAIRGSLSEKTAQVHRRIDELTDTLEEQWPDTAVLPIVHGDTHAAGIIPQAWLFTTNQAVAHNEAGLRGMSPDFEGYEDIPAFVDAQWSGEWSINRAEPFPEQYDTFVGSAGSIYHFAPVELNREHLQREGYPAAVEGDERIPVVGNSVVDAIEMKRDADLEESIFDIYPALEERDDWIRVDIHRRANLLPERFQAIVEGVIGLVEDGYNVNFVELTATRKALEHYGYRDRLLELDDERENFLFTGLWKKHAHVYEFLTSGQCFAEFTDSGSMQEELNYIDETICLTARFNTDRPETVFEAGTNLLVPPVGGEYVREMVEYVAETDAVREEIQTGPNLYGENVGESIVEFLAEKREATPFDWAHERVGFETGKQDFEYL